MKRIVSVELPDGSVQYVQPYHMSLEGHVSLVLCRDDEDYDAMVKIIACSARRKNALLIIYAVVSNHCHAAILASSQNDADAFAREVKKIFSMWFSRKYNMEGVLRKVDATAICLHDNHYTRNALAYIPRNALDNGCAISDYPWSGFRAMFSNTLPDNHTKVSSLTTRESERIMHTGDDLRGVGWLLDENDRLIPKSICSCWYLEQAFEGNYAYFLKTVGGQNSDEMRYDLIEKPRKMMRDSDLFKSLNDKSVNWFSISLDKLPVDKKIRLVTNAYHTCHTTVAQLSRVSGLDREIVAAITRKV